MSVYDLIVRNGTLVAAGNLRQADLAIADGRLVAIGPALEGSSHAEIDATGLHIFPGVIDAHVHLNEPGRADWEGFACGSRALAAGGTTTLCDMPLNAHPPTLDSASFDLKYQAASASSLVDFALWGGIVPGNLTCLSDLAERGVFGFKAFMSDSGMEDFPVADDDTLYAGMTIAASLGCIVAVHAENAGLTSGMARRAREEGGSSVRAYLDSRPVIAELEAISRAILFAQETGCALHIVHVSSGRGVRLVAEARQHGVDVSCETCPHYLVLDEEDVERLGAVAKCAPPLRARVEQEALWQAIFAGSLPMVASDHSPAPRWMKENPDFFQVWGGISGGQSLLQLLLTGGWYNRQLSLPTIASLTAEYVARRFKLAPSKGCLAVGGDADLVLLDLSASNILRSEDLFYRHRHSPYIGQMVRGQIIRTIVRGQTVFSEGKHISKPIGMLVKPQCR